MTKKRIIIALVLILVIIAGLLVFGFLRKEKTATVTPGETAQETQPAAPQENIEIIDSRLRKISLAEAVSPTLSSDGARVRYIGKEGGIHELDFDGSNPQKTELVVLPNLIGVLWAKSKTEFVGIYAGSEGKKMLYYDTKTKQSVPYDADVKNIAFSPAGDRVAYYRRDDALGVSAIITARPDNTEKTTALKTRLRDVRLAWPSEDAIAVSTAPSGLSQSLLWTLAPKTQKLFPVLSNVHGLTSRWSGDGEKVIFSKTDGNGQNLSLYAADKNGTGTKDLGVATIPEKCAFTKNSERAFCAVPSETDENMVWPDEYYQGLYKAREEIWEISLNGNAKQMRYGFADTQFDVSYPILSPDEDTLIFLNKKDGQIYSLEL